MEDFYVIGFIVGVYLFFGSIAWLINKVGEYRETRRYMAKLKKMAPQLDMIDVEELTTKVIAIKESYSCTLKQLQNQYSISDEDEDDKNIYKYIQNEANYRRSKRKPPTKAYRRYRRRYSRY